MGKFYFKLFVIALGVAFCIFFGVDLATKGVERINGSPDSQAHTVKASPAGQPAKNAAAPGGQALTAQATSGKGEAAKTSDRSAAAAKPGAEPVKAKQPQPVREETTGDSGINRFSNKAGELLHIIAFHGIRFVVSMLDAITG